jgi:hypothetical protein
MALVVVMNGAEIAWKAYLLLMEFAVMNGPAFEKFCNSGQVIEIVHGPLSGIRGVLIRMTDDGRAVLRLEGQWDISVVIPAENIELPPSS